MKQIKKEKNKRTRATNKGITLIALVVTILIILILSAITLQSLSGDNGLITKAIKAKFYTEMTQIDEQKEMSKILGFMEEGNDGDSVISDFLEKNLTAQEIKDFSNTLKAEIIFIRNSFGTGDILTTKQIWKNNLFECNDIFSNEDNIEGLTQDLLYISKNIVGETEKYIYDTVTDTCYKILPTDIGGKTVHSIQYAKFIIDGQNSTGIGIIDAEANIIDATDGTKSYEPDLSNFTYKTEVIYYSSDFTKQETMPVKEFLDSGKPSTMKVGEETYTFANYVSSSSGEAQVWANIRCTANGLESYWTWIPRFAYKLDGSVAKAEKSDIIFVDVNDKPCDGSLLPSDYVVHEAFKQKSELKGIWFSKYQPTGLETLAIDNTEPEMPDLNNFSEEDTTLIYYTQDGKKSTEVEYSLTPEQSIQVDGETYYFYNYENKIWANVKCMGNGLESYWVWIPRFAYKLESGESNVILVDENDKPIDKEKYGSILPANYRVHEAFNQGDGLRGMWFSKYQPTSLETGKEDTSEPSTPDLSNFDSSTTKIIYYTIDGKSSIEKDFSTNPERVITENGKNYYFYSYGSKIWANIKCTANGLESYWTWIPRFAYKLEKGTSKVIFVDENNQPLNTTLFGNSLPDNYVLHEAFTQDDGLKGIWFSKYQPTKVK